MAAPWPLRSVCSRDGITNDIICRPSRRPRSCLILSPSAFRLTILGASPTPAWQRRPEKPMASCSLVRAVLVTTFLTVSVPAQAFAQAQATTGVVRGTVRDPAGAPVAGAVVLIEHRETGLRTTVETNARVPRAHPAPPRYLRRDRHRARRVRLGPQGRAGAARRRDAPALAELRPGGTRGHHRHPRARRASRHRGCHQLAALLGRGGGRAAQQRPQLPGLHPAHARRVDLAGPRRRRTQRQRPARASSTTSSSTEPTSTTPSSASRGAASVPPSPSTRTPSRRWWW